ncbi:MAG TPA: hypothetical protein VE776_09255 [Actinomycetota bacterium]|nr:hypothetical protein [Actinomycetota bacterium]
MIALLRARLRTAGPCPGCPLYPHIRDRDLRFPTCELCHWPAVGVGRVHTWCCASCRHVNEHGSVRPRVSVALLRLAAVDTAALLLKVADTRCGRYLAPPLRPAAQRPRIRRRADGADGGRHRPAALAVRRRRPRVAGGPPVYARATVAGLPVLIVGGDRPYPNPLGRNEPASGAGSLGSRATRIACPCDQPSPCLHAQALYAHVVAWGPQVPRMPLPPQPWPPATGAAAIAVFRRDGRPAAPPPRVRSGRPGRSTGPSRRG